MPTATAGAIFTPPIRITPATPPKSRKGYEEDLTDWEDAEEHEQAGLSPSSSVAKETTPYQSFRPICRLAPPAVDITILTSMPPAKDASLTDTTCDESASSCSKGSSPDTSPKLSRSRFWSDVNLCEHPQKIRAQPQGFNNQSDGVSAKTWPCDTDVQHRGVSAQDWQHDYSAHHDGVSALREPYDQNVQQRELPEQKWRSGADISQHGVSTVDWHSNSEPHRNLSAENWQQIFVPGYRQMMQPHPTASLWNSAPDLSTRSCSQDSFPDAASSFTSRQPQVSVLNRIPENLRKDAAMSWIPPASYPAGASGMINQLAHRSHRLKEVMLATSSLTSTLSMSDIVSQDEDEDDGLDE